MAVPHHTDHELALQELRRIRGRLAHARHRDVVGEFDQRLTLGQRTADAFASAVGSWRFIIIQSVVLASWITLNIAAWIRHWDPYPFILLNLVLSFQAAYAAPIIMMSQNRSAELDRLQARADFDINQKAEAEIEEILTLLRSTAATLERLERLLAH